MHASSRSRARPRAWRSREASSTRCWRWPRAACWRSPTSRPRWWRSPRRRVERGRSMTTARRRSCAPPPTPTRSPRSNGCWPAPSCCCRDRPRSPTSSRTPTRWSATPGSRRWRSSKRSGCQPSPTTPGSRSTRSTVPRRPHRAVRRRPDCTYADNRRKLLGALAGIDDRRARFRTVALVRWPDGRELAVEGVCDGSISVDERGAAGGATTRCSFPPTVMAGRSPR